MKKKLPAKRKRQPSLDSIYRRVCQFQTTLLNQMALIRLDIVTERQADRALLRTITDHAARLLREKETLQRRNSAYETLEDAVKIPGTLWQHTYECNIKNTLRLGRGELPQCNCGAAKWSRPS
jgi:hypothetical protein